MAGTAVSEIFGAEACQRHLFLHYALNVQRLYRDGRFTGMVTN